MPPLPAKHAKHPHPLCSFFIMPRDLDEYRTDVLQHPGRMYIQKPVASSRGRGIKMVKVMMVAASQEVGAGGGKMEGGGLSALGVGKGHCTPGSGPPNGGWMEAACTCEVVP